VINGVSERLKWVLIDAATVVVSFFAAVALRFLDSPSRDLQVALMALLTYIGPVVVLFVGANAVSRLDHRVWRYASAAEVIPIFVTAMTATLIALAADLVLGLGGGRPVPLSVVILGGFFAFCGMVGARYRWRLASRIGRAKERNRPGQVRTVVFGAGEVGQHLAWRILNQPDGTGYQLVGFVDDDRAKQGMRIHGVTVLGSRSDLRAIVEREGIDLIVLAVSTLGADDLLDVVSIAQETTAQIKVLPSTLETITSKRAAPLLREMRVEDLLGRKPAAIDVEACKAVLRGKVVLVTGGCGSVGAELCRQTAAFAPDHLVVFDNNESGLFDLEVELRANFQDLTMTFVVGDVTDGLKMDRVFAETRPQVIFHAAAYKHVPMMQIYPEEAVRVNVRGTQLALAMARRYRAEHFVLVSTDKAVNPGSVMGATKRIGELLMMSAAPGQSSHQPILVVAPSLLVTAVRFGNVLGSRGSVVPTFARQIEMGGPVTVTHPEMTRYFMDVSEAACLILQAVSLTEGKDIFMLEMGERIRVDDLARKMIRMRGLRPDVDIPITYTGIRPGEKLHEDLVRPEDEIRRTSHPLIYRVVPRTPLGVDDLASDVDRLLNLADEGRRGELVQELMRVTGEQPTAQRGNSATVEAAERVIES
jgi:FlaA1/EpsC-like NDP-sugar epimerase